MLTAESTSEPVSQFAPRIYIIWPGFALRCGNPPSLDAESMAAPRARGGKSPLATIGENGSRLRVRLFGDAFDRSVIRFGRSMVVG